MSRAQIRLLLIGTAAVVVVAVTLIIFAISYTSGDERQPTITLGEYQSDLQNEINASEMCSYGEDPGSCVVSYDRMNEAIKGISRTADNPAIEPKIDSYAFWRNEYEKKGCDNENSIQGTECRDAADYTYQAAKIVLDQLNN